MQGFFVRPDLFVLLPLIMGFLIFLAVHILMFRLSKAQNASRIFILSLLLALLVDEVLVAAFSVAAKVSWIIFLSATILSAFLLAFLVLHYLSWFFGMGEAAIRIRLLRELDERPSKTATLDEILASYNAEKILKVRLERLVGAGHLTYDGQFYSNKSQILLLQLFVSNLIKHLLGIPVSG